METDLYEVKITKYLSPREIRDVCFKYFKISEETCQGRKKEIAYAKKFTVYAIKYFHTTTSLRALANFVNLHTHVITLYHLKIVQDQLDIEKGKKLHEFTDTWLNLRESLEKAAYVRANYSKQLIFEFANSLD